MERFDEDGNSFSDRIKNEIVRLDTITKKSKFGKSISERVLKPILREIEQESRDLMHFIGEYIQAVLQHNIQNSEPSGREYTVVMIDEGAEKGTGDKYVVMGTYTASAEGEPPASLDKGLGLPTGTLVDSIGFEVLDDGRVKVGLINSAGGEANTLFYRGGKVFISENDSGGTSAEVYGPALDNGFSNESTSAGPRPWYTEQMLELRPVIRKMIRQKMDAATRRAVKSGGFKVGSSKFIFRVNFDKNNRY